MQSLQMDTSMQWVCERIIILTEQVITGGSYKGKN